jgi:hypothetical protein
MKLKKIKPTDCGTCKNYEIMKCLHPKKGNCPYYEKGKK